MHKELLPINKEKINNPIQTWAKDLDRYFTEEEIQISNRIYKGNKFY